jgi:CubicO group peptidase (beta-lactamase class C family)
MNLGSRVPDSPYLFRYLAFAIATKAKQSVFDFRYFPFKVLKSEDDVALDYNLNPSIGHIHINQKNLNQPLDELVRNTDTLSFLVLKDGKVAYEYFADGINGQTPMLCYSITKSIFASYLSVLEANGVISFSDELSKYHSKLPDFVANRTFQSLMNMESGIRYTHGKSLFTDMAKFWLSPDIRKDLRTIRPCSEGNSYFYYNDIHLHLLTRMIDSRISDLSVDINHNFWQHLKPTSNALFCMDSLQGRYLKMDGGMVIAPHDLAKFGLLYANDGTIHGNQLLNSEWCANLKSSDGVRIDLEYWDLYRQMKHDWYPILSQGRTYYKNFWWGLRQNQGPNDIYAMGILGQFVFVSTRNNVVIVRQGNSWGVKGWWPYIFEELASKI